MMTDASAESRKVDKKTALALWDSAVLPPAARKRRTDGDPLDAGEDNDGGNTTMNFTLVTKRGNKQQVHMPNISSFVILIERLY
jgi:regulator of nonsense transcripts 2